MTIQATYHGEVRVVRSSYTSKTGPTITLALHDIDELNKVQGMDGKRYMLALVEIGDDEQPIQKPEAEKLKGGFAAEWLGKRCCEKPFQEFLTDSLDLSAPISSTSEAADVVRDLCGVSSRAHIDHMPDAKSKFDRHIRIPYGKWLAVNGSRSCHEEVEA